jgi:hypothetical protein
VWVGTGLLFQITVGAVLAGLFSPASLGSGETDFGEFAPWVFVMIYASFAGQGVALAIAFACHVRARWGWLLGERTGAIVARPAALLSSWPQRHLGAIAEVVAATGIALAVVLGYWAVGGSLGLPSGRQEIWPMQAARLTGALLAAVGLLAVAGRWGGHGRFWLPAALIWLGSGALVAFDGLNLVLNHMSGFFGTDASGWSLFDTVLTLKVGIGLVAAAVGALVIAAAVKDDRLDRGLPEDLGVRQAA